MRMCKIVLFGGWDMGWDMVGTWLGHGLGHEPHGPDGPHGPHTGPTRDRRGPHTGATRAPRARRAPRAARARRAPRAGQAPRTPPAPRSPRGPTGPTNPTGPTGPTAPRAPRVPRARWAPQARRAPRAPDEGATLAEQLVHLWVGRLHRGVLLLPWLVPSLAITSAAFKGALLAMVVPRLISPLLSSRSLVVIMVITICRFEVADASITVQCYSCCFQDTSYVHICVYICMPMYMNTCGLTWRIVCNDACSYVFRYLCMCPHMFVYMYMYMSI